MEHPYFYAPAFPLIYSSCLINIIFVNSFEYFIKDFNQVHSKSCATNGVVLSIKSFWEHIFESASLAKKKMTESYPESCYDYEFSYAQKMAL